MGRGGSSKFAPHMIPFFGFLCQKWGTAQDPGSHWTNRKDPRDGNDMHQIGPENLPGAGIGEWEFAELLQSGYASPSQLST